MSSTVGSVYTQASRRRESAWRSEGERGGGASLLREGGREGSYRLRGLREGLQREGSGGGWGGRSREGRGESKVATVMVVEASG